MGEKDIERDKEIINRENERNNKRGSEREKEREGERVLGFCDILVIYDFSRFLTSVYMKTSPTIAVS